MQCQTRRQPEVPLPAPLPARRLQLCSAGKPTRRRVPATHLCLSKLAAQRSLPAHALSRAATLSSPVFLCYADPASTRHRPNTQERKTLAERPPLSVWRPIAVAMGNACQDHPGRNRLTSPTLSTKVARVREGTRHVSQELFIFREHCFTRERHLCATNFGH